MPKKTGASKSGGKKKGSPNWIVYGLVILVVAVVLGFMTTSPKPKNGAKPKDDAGRNSASRSKSVEELEQQVRALKNALTSVAGKGHTESKVFNGIRAMAEDAEEVLRNAAAAETDEKRREVLEAGLAKREEWAVMLAKTQSGLLNDDEEEKKNGQKEGPQTVVALTEASFAGFVADHQRGAMVEFYAPWCGHCRKLAPVYESAARALAGTKGVALGKVDATKETKLARIYGVSRYPTIKWFEEGEPTDVETPAVNTEEKLVKWVERALEPSVTELDSGGDVDELLAVAPEGSMFCAGTGEKDGPLYKTFNKVSRKRRNRLVFLWDPSTAPEKAGIRFYKKGQDPEECTDSSSAEKVGEWLDGFLTNQG